MVTNVASSSGRKVATLFSQAGARVAAVDPDDPSGQKVANGIRAAGGEVIFASKSCHFRGTRGVRLTVPRVECNMTEADEVQAAVSSISWWLALQEIDIA